MGGIYIDGFIALSVIMSALVPMPSVCFDAIHDFSASEGIE